MTTLAQLHYTFDLNFYEIDLHKAGNHLTQTVSQYSDLIFRQQTKVDINFDEGSLKTSILVFGFISLITNYGSIRSTIDYLIKDAKTLQQLVVSELIKSGLDEKLILKQKRIYCAPDRIRRVLLEIERLENNKELTFSQRERELSRIKAAVINVCAELSDQDSELLITSINDHYQPARHGMPYWKEPYRFAAREEDVKSPSISFPPRIKTQRAEILTNEWKI